jgi:hypothetical protein
MDIVINESQELFQFSGTIKIDTSIKGITLFMNSAPKSGSLLKLVKVSKDRNIIALFSDNSLVDNSEITIFGFDKKKKSLILKSEGKNWEIVN